MIYAEVNSRSKFLLDLRTAIVKIKIKRKLDCIGFLVSGIGLKCLTIGIESISRKHVNYIFSGYIILVAILLMGLSVIHSFKISYYRLTPGLSGCRPQEGLALPATAFMYAIQHSAQHYIEEEKVALAFLFEPIFASLAGMVVLESTLDSHTISRDVLIVSAMAIAEIKLPLQRHRAKDRSHMYACGISLEISKLPEPEFYLYPL